MPMVKEPQGRGLPSPWTLPLPLLLALLLKCGAVGGLLPPSQPNPPPMPLVQPPPQLQPKTRAVWLWDTADRMSPADLAELFRFADAEGVGRIFLQIDPKLPAAAYARFIRTAAVHGVRVAALDGGSDWALPENRSKLDGLADWVRAYNAAVRPGERFAGIQLDIEPYLEAAWQQQPDRLARDWLAALEAFQRSVKAGSGLTTAAVIPFWLDTLPSPDGDRSLLDAMLQAVDETAVMAYRDSAGQTAVLAEEELAAADRLGKRVWVGVETRPAPGEPQVTYYEEGKAVLEAQLRQLETRLKGHPSFAGAAVHDEQGWRRLHP